MYRESVPGPDLPSDLDGRHALALPAGADVRALAAAWFAGSLWEVFPLGPDPAALAGMADRRARGGFPAPAPRPGVLRLTARVRLTGPWSLPADQARAVGLPDRDLDLYGLDPQASDPLVLGWMTAVARHTGGAVISADRSQAIVPDAGAAVDLTLWTGTVVPSGDLVAAVRPFLAGSRPGPVEQQPGDAYSMTSRFEFDGALTLAAQPRDAVPVAVATQRWGEHGPWTYSVTWVPPDPAELTAEQPSRLHLIARSRVAPVVARAARALLQLAGGVVVDDGGFPISDDELTRRGTTL